MFFKRQHRGIQWWPHLPASSRFTDVGGLTPSPPEAELHFLSILGPLSISVSSKTLRQSSGVPITLTQASGYHVYLVNQNYPCMVFSIMCLVADRHACEPYWLLQSKTPPVRGTHSTREDTSIVISPRGGIFLLDLQLADWER